MTKQLHLKNLPNWWWGIEGQECRSLSDSRPASSTTAAPAGTGSTPWTSWATTGPSCATRRTGTPARADASEPSEGPEEEPAHPRGCPPKSARVPDVPSGARAPRHSTRHWDITVENVHFCTCYLFAVHSGTMHSDFGSHKGPFTLAFPPPQDLWPEMGVSLWLRSGWKIPFLFFFFSMCCIVKSNHASLIAVHWQTPYSAFKFLFFSLPLSRTPSWHPFFPVQASWCFLLLWPECRASFNQSHFRHFYAVFY